MVAQRLICNGAANNTSTGHIDASVVPTLRGLSQLPALQSAINAHIENHSNFTTPILPAIYAPFRGTCHLPKIRGLEDSVVALIADFAGVVRGRQLRNLREAYKCL